MRTPPFFHTAVNEHRNFKYNELDADVRGSWVAHLANYHFEEQLLEDVIKLIYHKYQLEDGNYPSLDERLFAIRNQITGIHSQNLPEIFQLSTFFYGLEKYDMAIDCLLYIENRGYTNEWLLNNLGVAYLRELLTRPYYRDAVFIYPVEFESQRSIKGSGESIPPEKMISEAERFFRQSIQMNPNYESARIHLSIAFLIQQRYQTAIEELDFASPKICALTSQASMIKAIAYAHLNQKKEALYYFEKSLDSQSLIARYNFKIYKELSSGDSFFTENLKSLNQQNLFELKKKVKSEFFSDIPLKQKYNTTEYSFFKTTSGLNLNALSIELQTISQISLSSGKTRPNLQFHFLKMENYTYWHLVFGYPTTIRVNLFSTGKNYKGKTAMDIHPGMPVKQLIEKIGAPDLIADQFFLYREQSIMYEIVQEKVKGWITFEII